MSRRLGDDVDSKYDDISEDSTSRKRRLSWTLTDTYYSIPQYQYRGKAGQRIEQEIQVNESCFEQIMIENSKKNDDKEKKLASIKSYAAKSVSTSDIIDYIKIGSMSKEQLMSETSLESNKSLEKKFYIYNWQSEKRFRKVSEPKFKADELHEKMNDTNQQHFEHICPTTGLRRLTILTPQLNNINAIEVEEFEEYTVIENAIDTSDLGKHVSFDNYTYIQLLSEKVLPIDSKIIKKKMPPSSLLLSGSRASINSAKKSMVNNIKNFFSFFFCIINIII
jgi:hypothetical protein